MSSELHIFGQLSGFQLIDQSNFYSNINLFVNYQLEYGENWKLISGKQFSTTACSNANWSEPLDWHFALNSVQNWPKIKFVVFKENLAYLSSLNYFEFDTLENNSIPFAQGSCFLPSEPGRQIIFVKLSAPKFNNIWSSTTNFLSQYSGLYLRKNIINLENLFDKFNENSDLESEVKLTIKLDIYVINRFFKKFGVDCK